jgi:hypothetical protein
MRRFAGSFGSRSGTPAITENDGEFLRENARQSTPSVTWVGHATLLVQMDHLTFLTEHTPNDAILPVDVGKNTYSFGHYFEYEQQVVLMSGGYPGSIGFR